MRSQKGTVKPKLFPGRWPPKGKRGIWISLNVPRQMQAVYLYRHLLMLYSDLDYAIETLTKEVPSDILALIVVLDLPEFVKSKLIERLK